MLIGTIRYVAMLIGTIRYVVITHLQSKWTVGHINMLNNSLREEIMRTFGTQVIYKLPEVLSCRQPKQVPMA